MPSDAPSHRYYRLLHGRWSGSFAFVVVRQEAWRALPLFERVRFSLFALVCRWFGPASMRTTLDYATAGDRDEVGHTTRMSKWGIPLYGSAESIHLGADGRSFVVRGSPLGEAAGEVEPSGDGAVYRVPWFGGCTLVQRTRVVPDGVAITQDTPWSHAEVTLVRR